jgi:hypothetical protein
MSIFDKTERHDTSAANFTAPQFDYLNRSARKSAEIIRNSIEGWFKKFPEDGKGELEKRLRSNNDTQFLSAYFELYINALLQKLQSSVEIHPVVGKESKRPDFIVTDISKKKWILETTLAKDQSDSEEATEARKNVVYDSISKLDTSDFFIGMDLKGDPKTPPPGRLIRGFLNDKLKDLNVDALRKKLEEEGYESMPRWLFEYEAWHIDFYPIPKSKITREKDGNGCIGIMSHEPRWIDTSASIKRSIKKKATEYGEIQLPYVIAVNCMGIFVNRNSILDALFGKNKYIFKIKQDGTPIGDPDVKRDLNGALISKGGPVNTRVSAILIGNAVTPWNRTESSLMLYHNPYAQRPYNEALCVLDEAIPKSDGSIEFKKGLDAHKILELEPIFA